MIPSISGNEGRGQTHMDWEYVLNFFRESLAQPDRHGVLEILYAPIRGIFKRFSAKSLLCMEKHWETNDYRS